MVAAAAAAAVAAAVAITEAEGGNAQTAASGLEGAEEDVTACAALDGDPLQDSALPPPAKRRKSAKPKPEPVPFAHGPRINSDIEEEVMDLDDLASSKVNHGLGLFTSFRFI